MMIDDWGGGAGGVGLYFPTLKLKCLGWLIDLFLKNVTEENMKVCRKMFNV